MPAAWAEERVTGGEPREVRVWSEAEGHAERTVGMKVKRVVVVDRGLGRVAEDVGLRAARRGPSDTRPRGCPWR